MWLMQNAMGKPENAGAGSSDYMHLFGLVVLGYMWARMVKVAQAKIAAGDTSPHLATKLVTGKFFMERMLPETVAHLARIEAGTYGLCRVSGLPIPKERLRAIPWATERVEYKVGGLGRR